MASLDTSDIALELYTVRDETARDFGGTLRRVAEIGYQAVEFAGYGGLDADAMADLLEDVELEAAATHVPFEAVRADPAGQIEYCRTIGCRYLILPSLPRDWQDQGGIETLAPLLNEIGETCREQHITFGYHNHDFEFRPVNGGTLLESLLGSTDPNLFVLELDVYWAAYAGVDPIEVMRTYAGRVPILHLKDMAPDRSYTEVGDGTLGLDRIYRMAPDMDVQWCIVEHDAPTMPSLESARRSLENLRRMTEAG